MPNELNFMFVSLAIVFRAAFGALLGEDNVRRFIPWSLGFLIPGGFIPGTAQGAEFFEKVGTYDGQFLKILQAELRAADLYQATAQAFVVLLPVKSVGVMGSGSLPSESTAKSTGQGRSCD